MAVGFAALLVLALIQEPPATAELVRRLESEDIAEREAAQAELRRRGESIVPELERLSAGADPEASVRIAELIESFRWWDRTGWARRGLVDLRTGRLLWHVVPSTEWESFRSEVSGREVTVCFQDGRLERRSLKDGTLLWRATSLEEDEVARGSLRHLPTLRATPGAVFRGGLRTVRAADPSTGRALWKLKLEGLPNEIFRRDIVAGEGQLVLLASGTAISIDPASGVKRWEARQNVNQAIVLPGGDVVGALGNDIVRFRAADGSAAWRASRSGTYIGHQELLFLGGFLATGSGRWAEHPWTVCLDPRDGSERWRTEAGGLIGGAASPDGRRLFLAVHRYDLRVRKHVASLLAVETRSWETAWQAPLERDGADVRTDGRSVLVSQFSRNCCSMGPLLRLDARDGGELWRAAPRGIPSDYPEFLHRDRLELRDGKAVLIGESFNSDYVEAFGLLDGAPVLRWASR